MRGLLRRSAGLEPAEAVGASGEARRPTSPSQAVAVDLGGDRGALVVRTGPEHEGVEVEVHPLGRPEERTHVWVLPRSVATGVVHAAVFPSLRAGSWVVLGADGAGGRVVEVPAGTVAEVDWP